MSLNKTLIGVLVFVFVLCSGVNTIFAAAGERKLSKEEYKIIDEMGDEHFSDKEVVKTAKIKLLANNKCEVTMGKRSFKTEYMSRDGKLFIGSINNDFAIEKILNKLDPGSYRYSMEISISREIEPKGYIENLDPEDSIYDIYTSPIVSIKKNKITFAELDSELNIVSTNDNGKYKEEFIDFFRFQGYCITDKFFQMHCPSPKFSTVNNKYFLPLRFVFENFGFSVSYDAKEKAVIITAPNPSEAKINFDNNGNATITVDDKELISAKYIEQDGDILLGDSQSNQAIIKLLEQISKGKTYRFKGTFEEVEQPDKSMIGTYTIQKQKSFFSDDLNKVVWLSTDSITFTNGHKEFSYGLPWRPADDIVNMSCGAPIINSTGEFYLPIKAIFETLGFEVAISNSTETSGHKIKSVSIKE